MRVTTRFLPIGFLLILTLMLAACSSSTSTSTGSYGSGSATPPTATTNTGTTGTTPTSPGKVYATPTTGTSGATTIKTASATVNGKSVTILTDAQGMTLYYFTPDTKTTSACTGGCASAWPPLLITGKSGSTTTLPGTLTVVTNANGNQEQYQGHFLYTYGGDSAPGQTNGEGISGKWFVATTTLA